MRESFEYRTVSFAMDSDTTLLAYTDGLVERRGETIDVGLHRLQETAVASRGDLDTMLTRILSEMTPNGADDDTALLGFRWT